LALPQHFAAVAGVVAGTVAGVAGFAAGTVVHKVFPALEVLRIEVPNELGGDPHKVYIVHLLRTRPEEVVWSKGRSWAFPSRAGLVSRDVVWRIARRECLLILLVRSATFTLRNCLLL